MKINKTLVAILAASIFVTACGTRQIVVKYDEPNSLIRAVPDAPKLTIGAFLDSRFERPSPRDSQYIGAFRNEFGIPVSKWELDRPVTDALKSAFLGGVRARGYHDKSVGDYVISGNISVLEVNSFPLVGVRPNIEVDVTVTKVATGTEVFRRVFKGPTSVTYILFSPVGSSKRHGKGCGVYCTHETMAQFLAETCVTDIVDNVLDDEDFRQSLSL